MKFLKKEDGITLIEIMASLVLILILIIGFSGAFINGLRSEALVDQRLEARRISDSIIERLRNNRGDWDISTSIDDYSLHLVEKGDNENSGVDIIVSYDEVETNLFLFEITWEDRNYSNEILLTGGDDL
ncbi:prepilin-type N-terminal cleavage/methylation domain-containing protein [Halanaerobium sp. Z-7514]|uniref:Prepilin-type N-terminal cleavage/methylation domain-containing protein n=1 Tax=Halanaerobium polyolivorans TaxID=2886943 RepID=A0AAW4WVX8_9FIRM|nr:prepilin-type N-terminal cleavage/methylation domain-containing protein [Halanaerobium polyolivorans]MCC3143733.1 prepilin-type N-terminal cleavage/methylation domain-containing protein [Halanaerobium polyolivorans]